MKHYEGNSSDIVKEILGNVVIDRTENGKPFLVNDERFINWSHNKKYFILAISLLGDIGVDVENKNIEYINNLYEWVLHKEEKEMLKNNVSFSEIWTRKESFLKYIGKGLTDDMNIVSSYSGVNGFIQSLKIDEIVISVCSKYKENINIIII